MPPDDGHGRPNWYEGGCSPLGLVLTSQGTSLAQGAPPTRPAAELITDDQQATRKRNDGAPTQATARPRISRTNRIGRRNGGAPVNEPGALNW